MAGRLRQSTEREEAREDIYIEVVCIEVNVLVYNPVNGRSGVGS